MLDSPNIGLAACARKCGLFTVQTIAQQFAGFEEGDLLVIDLNSLAGAGVAANAGIARFHREGTKAAQFNPITLCKGVDDFFEDSVDDTLDMALRQVRIFIRDFLDQFGFEYEFISSASQYESGAFDDALKNVLRNYQGIMDIMLPTLRKERAATYSPILPISEKTGVVLQVPVEVVDAEAGLVRFDDDGDMVTQSVLGGKSKLQWKVDWAMRWVALGVDYEMYGKDLTDSGVQSGKIARVLGGRPPESLIYEMFLDEKGEKISKSKGNGLALEDWLKYGTENSVAFYAFREPKSAKQLHLGVVPKAVDEYFQFRAQWHEQPLEKRLGNPVHHVHNGQVPSGQPPVTFGLLLNLVGVMGAGATEAQVWGYLGNYADNVSPENAPELAELIPIALAYNRDFVAPTLQKRKPEGVEVAALQTLDARLAELPADATAEDIQNIVYEIGKEGGFENLRDWFKALYETLLGSSAGPRMGSFIALYGIANSRQLIAEALA